MQACELTLGDASCFATRSGYTGEDGYEISVPLDAAERAAQQLLADPAVMPIGLGARDTLRLEAGLPLHGNELSPSISPIEAGLAFAVARSRRTGGAKAGGFPGAARVLRELVEGAPRQLIGLVSNEGVPVRAHAAVVDSQDRQVGEVTSGTISPSLGKAVMLALVNRNALAEDAILRAVVRDKRPLLERVTLPFVPKRYRR
jgi:aminomethyltransferase